MPVKRAGSQAQKRSETPPTDNSKSKVHQTEKPGENRKMNEVLHQNTPCPYSAGKNAKNAHDIHKVHSVRIARVLFKRHCKDAYCKTKR